MSKLGNYIIKEIEEGNEEELIKKGLQDEDGEY